jgi:hypothetical protein
MNEYDFADFHRCPPEEGRMEDWRIGRMETGIEIPASFPSFQFSSPPHFSQSLTQDKKRSNFYNESYKYYQLHPKNPFIFIDEIDPDCDVISLA